MLCIKYDSFKLSLQLYCRYMKGSDISKEIMHRLSLSIRDSCKFIEIKLFYIHEHFDTLDVEGLNYLMDVLILVVGRS